MVFEQFSYLMTVIVFAFGAVLIEWSLGFEKLKKYWKLIGVVIIISLLATFIAEPVALRWENWIYNTEQTFNIFIFGAALETYFFAGFVSIAIASATLGWSNYEEEKRPLIKSTLQEISKKLKK